MVRIEQSYSILEFTITLETRSQKIKECPRQNMTIWYFENMLNKQLLCLHLCFILRILTCSSDRVHSFLIFIQQREDREISTPTWYRVWYLSTHIINNHTDYTPSYIWYKALPLSYCSPEVNWPAILLCMGQEKGREIQEFHLEKVYICQCDITAHTSIHPTPEVENLPNPGWWSIQQNKPAWGETQTSASPAHRKRVDK